MMKAQKQRAASRVSATRQVTPREFTDFVSAQHPSRQGECRLESRRFELDDQWRADIEWAVGRAPRKKATGCDEVFSEALQCSTALLSEWLHEVWASCGRHGIVPTAWCQTMLCPLLKKEPASEPSNWRAIALLSHCRKVIEKVLDKRVREEYRFHHAQCGVRAARSVDTALIRMMRSIKMGCKVICVLDLKQAYASVPRGDLIVRLRQVLSPELAKMSETMLIDTKVYTVGILQKRGAH